MGNEYGTHGYGHFQGFVDELPAYMESASSNAGHGYTVAKEFMTEYGSVVGEKLSDYSTLAAGKLEEINLDDIQNATVTFAGRIQQGYYDTKDHVTTVYPPVGDAFIQMRTVVSESQAIPEEYVDMSVDLVVTTCIALMAYLFICCICCRCGCNSKKKKKKMLNK